MEERRPVRAAGNTSIPDDPAPRWRTVLKVAAVLVLMLVSVAVGAGIYVNGKLMGATTIGGFIEAPLKTAVVLRDPARYFPGRDRITVLCVGLDRNIIISRDPRQNGMPSTRNARTDVLMVASLDLVSREVSVLSIPRDTRVQLPNRRSFSKINQAHADGGIPYTREAVEEFIGAPIDYHVVIKQEAIQAVVDSLGGVPVDVEKDMDYDDNWGQLHIHLKQGNQVLNGEQVVGYLRFRHDAEGDLGRIRRQQQVIQTLSQQVKSPQVLLKAAGLIDAIHRFVKTDLTREQQVALAHLFHSLQPGSVQTVSLPVAATATIGGISYVIADEDRKEAAVDWVVRGNKDAMNRLIRVDLRNASGDRELYQKTYDCLRHYGFDVRRAGAEKGEPAQSTRVVQHTSLRGSGRRVLEVLGLTGTIQKEETRGPDVTLYVGKDLSSSQVLAYSELWPEIPPRRVTVIPRSERRRRSADFEAVPVRVRAADDAPGADAGEADVPMEIPGAAEPHPSEGAEPQGEPAPPAGEKPPVDRPGTDTR